jgi:succinate dehydrogenase (ubiquinone) membrane anchor subunit
MLALSRTAALTASRPATSVAAFHAARACRDVPKDTRKGFSFLMADEGREAFKLYHKTHFVALAGAPLAFALSPLSPMLNMPVDLALGVAFPLHAHIGMNWIIRDYVPPAGQGAARGAMAAATVVAALGLLKLNLMGDGITETIKTVWREPASKSA